MNVVNLIASTSTFNANDQRHGSGGVPLRRFLQVDILSEFIEGASTETLSRQARSRSSGDGGHGLRFSKNTLA